MVLLKTFALFVATVLAEIFGCCLPYLCLRPGGSARLLLPGAASLVTDARRRLSRQPTDFPGTVFLLGEPAFRFRNLSI